MLKVFIPEKIFQKLIINFFEKLDFENLEKNFKNIKIENFETKFISGKYFELEEDLDFLIFCNGFFWKKFFYEMDFTKKQIFTFGKSFYSDKNYFEDFWKISEDFAYISEELHSTKLLTNTRKKELLEKITYAFFLLSGIYFNLYVLLQKTEKNIFELENIEWKSEYEATALLIIETSKTKKVELEAKIQVFEEKFKLFYEIISKIYVL